MRKQVTGYTYFFLTGAAPASAAPPVQGMQVEIHIHKNLGINIIYFVGY